MMNFPLNPQLAPANHFANRSVRFVAIFAIFFDFAILHESSQWIAKAALRLQKLADALVDEATISASQMPKNAAEILASFAENGFAAIIAPCPTH